MTPNHSFLLAVRAMGQHHSIEIDQLRFEKIQAASINLHHICNLEEQWSAVVQNYFDLEQGLLDAAVRYMIIPDQGHQSFSDLQLYFSVRLANLLSRCRSYVDQTKRHLAGLIPPCDEVDAFKSACSHEYDNRYGYRFMEAMRNYSQHYGLPLHGSSYGIKRQKSDLLEYYVATEINLDQLKGDKHFKQAILKEVTNEKLPAEPLIREYVAGLSVVHLKLRKLLNERMESWMDLIRGAIAEHAEGSPGGNKVPGLYAMKISEANECVQAVHLGENLVQRVEILQKRHGSLENVPRSFVSSAPRPGKK